MKIKKLFNISLMVASFSLVAGVLASCGGNKPEEDEGIVVDVWNTFNAQQTPSFETISRTFESIILEKEGVKVTVKNTRVGGYDEMEKQISNGFTVGKAPTIAVAYPDNVAKYIASEENPGDHIVDLTPLITDEKIGLDAEDELCHMGITDFVPSYLDEGMHYTREGILSLPFEKSTELMLYNKDQLQRVLSDRGIKTPVDLYMNNIKWGEFMDLINYINEHREKYGLKDTEKEKKYVLFYDSDSNLFISQSFQRDIPYISLKDGKGSIDFADPGTKERVTDMLTEFRDAYQAKLLCTGDTENKYGSDYFKSNRCLFTVGSTGGSGYSDTTDFKIGVCKFPVYQTSKVVDGKTVYEDIPVERQKFVSQGVTLALFSNPAADKQVNDLKIKYGWKFLKYLTNPTNSIEMCIRSNGYVPPRKSSYDVDNYKKFIEGNGYMNKCAKTVIRDIDGAYFNYPVFPRSANARDEVGALVSKVLKLDDKKVNTIPNLIDEAKQKVNI